MATERLTEPALLGGFEFYKSHVLGFFLFTLCLISDELIFTFFNVLASRGIIGFCRLPPRPKLYGFADLLGLRGLSQVTSLFRGRWSLLHSFFGASSSAPSAGFYVLFAIPFCEDGGSVPRPGIQTR